jgi:hypothetical protein
MCLVAVLLNLLDVQTIPFPHAEVKMIQRVLLAMLSIVLIAGLATGLCEVFGGPREESTPAAGAKDDQVKEPNLSFWVPDEELRVWDPVNTNVPTVPWRVYGPRRDDGTRSDQFRHTAVGKLVRVEGIAWGYDVLTIVPKSRVVFEGGTVLVKGADFNKPNVRGRLVRVMGTLHLDPMPHPGFKLQLPNYYWIDAQSFEIISLSATRGK